MAPSDAPEPSPNQRPTLSIVTLGHHRHGKTTLTAALAQVLARSSGFRCASHSTFDLDKSGGSPPTLLDEATSNLVHSSTLDGLSTLTIAGSRFSYDTPSRRIVHLDAPGRRSWLKNVAREIGCADAALLVVSAVDSVAPQTYEHLLVARALGIRQVIGFITQCDQVRDVDMLDLVEVELRELLGQAGYDGDETRVIRGAALPVLRGEPEWEPTVRDLIDAIEHDLTIPERSTSTDTMLWIDRLYHGPAPENSVIACGRLLRGSVAKGNVLQLAGDSTPFPQAPPRKGTEPYAPTSCLFDVLNVETFNQAIRRGSVGDHVGLQLRPRGKFEPGALSTGQALVKRRELSFPRTIRARLDLLSRPNGGRRTPFFAGHQLSLVFGVTTVCGKVTSTDPAYYSGTSPEVQIALDRPTFVERNMPFAIRDGSHGRYLEEARRGQPRWAGIIGSGVVLELEDTIATKVLP